MSITWGRGGGTHQKNGCHGSMSSLVVAARINQVENESKSKRDMAKSCGDLYMASIANNNRPSTGASTKSRVYTTGRSIAN